MKIKVIYFGKKSDFNKIQEEYLKRIGAFADISILCLKPISIKENNTREEVMKKEALVLEKYFANDYTIVLEREGKEMSTRFFSEVVKSLNDQGRNMTFIIGGAYGVDPTISGKADLLLSMSKMTFPHELARVILLEQIYRVFTIIKGKTYHY